MIKKKKEQINKSYSFESSLECVSNSNFSSFFTLRKFIFQFLTLVELFILIYDHRL